MARTGFAAKGIVYLLLGYLGARAAVGSSQAGSTDAVLLEVLRAPLGRLLLTTLAVGLAWYAAWRFIESIGDANGKGHEPKGLAARAIYLVSGCIYAALALDAAAILLHWDNDAGQVRSFLGAFMTGPLAVAAGLLLLAYGVYQLWKGVLGKMSTQLNERAARREAGRWVIGLSRAGVAGRGAVFVVLGYWLVSHPASGPSMASTSGTAGSLNLFARFPQGETFMAAAALALMAYGAHQLVHSRYRTINVP